MSSIVKTLRVLSLVLLVTTFITGCDKWKHYWPDDTKGKTIAQLVSGNKDFKLLKQALIKTGLYDAVNKPGNFTVFAPDNAAFAAAGFPNAAAINNANVETLKSILLYHVLGTKITAGQIPVADNTPVETLSGKSLYVTKKDNKVCVNGVPVIAADIMASNGVVHVVGKVLIPPTGNIVELAQGNSNFTYLVAAVVRASQGSTNVAAALSGAGPLTVFAPTNQAFINAGFPTIESINAADPAALTSILTYHVVAARVFSCNLVDNAEVTTLNGGKLTIKLAGGAKVKGSSNSGPSNIVITDLVATNGVVHVIDQVLLP